MDLANVIRTERKKKQLTQRDLAKLADIDVSMVVRIERGETKTVKSDTLLGLAKALDVSADYLIGRKMGMGIDDIIRLNPAAKDIFWSYARLSPGHQEVVKRLIAFLLDSETKPDAPPIGDQQETLTSESKKSRSDQKSRAPGDLNIDDVLNREEK